MIYHDISNIFIIIIIIRSLSYHIIGMYVQSLLIIGHGASKIQLRFRYDSADSIRTLHTLPRRRYAHDIISNRIHGAAIYMLTLGVSILMGSMLPYIAYIGSYGCCQIKYIRFLIKYYGIHVANRDPMVVTQYSIKLNPMLGLSYPTMSESKS